MLVPTRLLRCARNDTVFVKMGKLFRPRSLSERLHHLLPYEAAIQFEAQINEYNAELTNVFPANRGRILPTKLGNVMAAFEEYPEHKYGMEGITFWPRMIPVLVKQEFAPYIAEHRSTMDFLLNTSFLLGIFGFECLLLRIILLPNIVWVIPISINIIRPDR